MTPAKTITGMVGCIRRFWIRHKPRSRAVEQLAARMMAVECRCEVYQEQVAEILPAIQLLAQGRSVKSVNSADARQWLCNARASGLIAGPDGRRNGSRLDAAVATDLAADMRRARP